jgi:ABC-type sugar transport system substrate-binding protein
VIDTPLVNGAASITVAFDNYKSGEIAAEKVVKLLNQKYGEPSGFVLNCYGDLSSVAWRLRKEGFENTIKKYKKIQLINKETDGDLTKMYDVTNEILVKYPDLDAIHAPSETPAFGVYEALKANNKLHPVGSTNHIIFVTIDGEPIAHKWIKEGFLDASISQDPIAYGEICVQMLIDYVLENKPLPKGNYSNDRYYWKNAEFKMTTHGSSLMIPPFIIDQNNVDDDRHWANIAYDKWGLKYL